MGGSPGTRTLNLRVKSPTLCQIELATLVYADSVGTCAGATSARTVVAPFYPIAHADVEGCEH